MTPDYEKFGRNLFDYLCGRGWYSVPRRELTIALLHYADESGLFGSNEKVHSLSSKSKISVNTLEGLLRDRDLFFNDLKDWSDHEFFSWLKSNNYTGDEDLKRGLGVFIVENYSQKFHVESYLESFKIVPDYKNNKKIIVFDLVRLVEALSKKAECSTKNLMLEVIDSSIKHKQKLAQEDDTSEDLQKLFLKAVREQVDKKLGTDTAALVIEMFKCVRKKMSG